MGRKYGEYRCKLSGAGNSGRVRAAAAAACDTEGEDEEGAAERAEWGRCVAAEVWGAVRWDSVGPGAPRPCRAVHWVHKWAGSGRGEGEGLPREWLRV